MIDPDEKRQGEDHIPPSEPGGEAVILEVTDVLDLHTFRPQEIPEAAAAYLGEAHAKGFATVRIIHGKGIGLQRERVHAVLRRTPFVERFQDAPAGAGGWGATIVWFRKSSEPGRVIPVE
jgi:dsDNA-specific endonuclease/ATPase MutS2